MASIVLLIPLAGLSAITGFVARSRRLEESLRTIDSVNRLRREGKLAISARGLIVAFEEQLATAKRGHGLLLWIGRTLFVVTLGLFSAAVASTISHGADPWTITLGATSMAGAIFAVARNVPETIAQDVDNVVQAQLILTGAHRQINMLERDAFASLNTKDATRDDGHMALLATRDRIEAVVDAAVEQIERFADPQPEARAIQFRRASTA